MKGKKITQCGLCGNWFRKSRVYTLIQDRERNAFGKEMQSKIRACPACYKSCGYKGRANGK